MQQVKKTKKISCKLFVQDTHFLIDYIFIFITPHWCMHMYDIHQGGISAVKVTFSHGPFQVLQDCSSTKYPYLKKEMKRMQLG